MIKTDNGKFYMTAGEACYIARSVGGSPSCVWFGARVEPEDDVFSEDGITDEAELEVNGKTYKLEIKGFEIEDKPHDEAFPTMGGGDTLIVHTASMKSAVEVDLLYTPYPRGGLSRRAVVRNIGDKPVSISVRLCVPAVGAAATKRGYIEISGDGTTSVAAVYGGKYVFAHDGAVVKCGIEETRTLEPSERFITPEILCVHTDGDGGKAARIFHDIVREHVIDRKYFGVRRPISFACADIGSADAAITAAKRCGADAFIAALDGVKREVALSLSRKCGDNGLKLGAAFDVSRYKDIDCAAQKIESVVRETGAQTVALRGFDGDGDYAYWQKAYALLRDIRNSSAQPTVEGNGDLGSLCYCATSGGDAPDYIPLCARSTLVTGERASLKTEFDLASFGCIGYSLALENSGEGIARAVRAQVFSYQDDADLIVGGDLYNKSCAAGETAVVVSKDKSCAYAVFRRGDNDAKNARIQFVGLDSHNLYHVREIEKTLSGAALRAVGVAVPKELGSGDTVAFHLMQVVDYE